MANIIEMPKLSDTMTVGTLIKWLKKEGDVVKAGDMLAEVETDKATMELESFFDGTILKIFSPAGSQVPLGAALCAIGKPGEKVDAPAPKAAPAAEEKKPAEAAPAPAAAAPVSTPAPVSAPAPVTPPAAPVEAPAKGGRVKISPLARKLAEEKKIDFSRVKGTGPGGRIVRADILAAEKNPPPAAKSESRNPKSEAPSWAYRSVFDKSPIQADAVVPASNMRATIARRLLEAKTSIPHFYLDLEVDAEPLTTLRAQLNAGLAKDGVKLSVNDFVLKAAAAALRAVPAVNSSWTGTGIQLHGAVHVSFAVAIEDGLITPVIKNTDTKTLFQISTEAKALGGRAKDKKLQPAEFTGGTFCVSNLGMAGIDRFCAIINPPNAAILAIGATVKKPVVKDDQIVIGQRLNLTLSGDHRVVDGLLGAKFLNAVKAHLESPALLLL